LSQEIKDLVDKLLEPDPQNRITAQEVCNHSALQSLQS
jgi:serine/threonine protein kinase